MKKIHLYLCGGLGNQLFEYAAARNLAIKNNSQLIIDINSGFITDFRDPTKFSLKSKNLHDTKLSSFNFFFLFYRFLKKFGNLDKFLEKYFNFRVIDETSHNLFDEKTFLYRPLERQKFYFLNLHGKLIVDNVFLYYFQLGF